MQHLFLTCIATGDHPHLMTGCTMNGSLLLAVERTENLVRRGSHPRLSVILIVEGSPSYTMRALESIQNQDLYDLQIVVVCRGVVAGVRHSLEVAADRDIHIDLIDVEDAKRGACLRAGFAASRGSQIIAMNADEWFAPQSLSKMVNIACDTTADIVLPTVSLDRYDAHRERHSRVLDAAHISIDSKSSMVAGLPQLILGGLVVQTSGVMYSRSLFEACLLCDKVFRTVGFMACAFSQTRCVSGCGDACFHTAAPKLTDAFDPTMYAKVSDDTRALDELADSLSEADSGGRLKLASQKFYFAGLVACIENLCLSPHGVSSIERSARMRDMLDAPRTRQMVAALKDNHRGLGLLFGPIASAKPARCVMCTHLAAFLNRTGAKTA